jgi:ribosomal protein S18 acetylase RimI-like enzyme
MTSGESDAARAAAGDVVTISKELYLGPVHDNNLEQLRRLQEAILPVQYKDQFYRSVVALSKQRLARLAYFKDVVVAAACCRVEERNGERFMYVMTLATLPAYRGRGIGSALLTTMIARAKEMGLKGAFLHVWTTNEEAHRFYERFNFSVVETIHGYYKRIDPPDCHILETIF